MLSSEEESNRRRRWWVLAAAAASVVLIGGGALEITQRGTDTDVTPNTLADVDVSASTDVTPTTQSPDVSTSSQQVATVPETTESDMVVQPWVATILSGNGPQTVAIPDDPVYRLPGAVDAVHDGSGEFRVTVTSVDGAGTEFADTLVDTVGPYSGRLPWSLNEDDGPMLLPTTIDVVADGNWSLQLFSIVQDEFRRFETLPGATISGTGDDVIQILDNTVAYVVDFDCPDCASTATITDSSDMAVLDQQAEGVGVDTSFVLRPSSYFLEIATHAPGAAGNWTMTIVERYVNSTTTTTTP